MALPNPVREQMDRPDWIKMIDDKSHLSRRQQRAMIQQSIDKNDPLMGALHQYKEANRMKTLGTYEDLVHTVEGKRAVVSIKTDGEINLLGFDGNDARLVSMEGRVRRGLPLLDEAVRKLRGGDSSIFVVELYGVDEHESELPYPKAISMLRAPRDESEEKRIRAAIFDVLEYNGRDISNEEYWKRMTVATNVFGRGTYIQPVYATEDGESVVERLWTHDVLEKGHEGLVVRVDGSYKIRPVNTFDLAVTGVEVSETHPEWAGALLLAFMDNNGNFRDAGKVGSGLTHKDREDWFKWAEANKVDQHERYIFVDPFSGDRVIEVRYEGLNVRGRPAAKFQSCFRR